MYFPLFASFIIFVIWLAFQLHHTNNKAANHMETYLEKEMRSNHVRKKPLDDLEYITIPLERFPMSLLTDDPVILECHQTLETLSTEKIVNFTGISNTDLKLTYGTANLTALSRYDQNYTSLARTLQTFGSRLYEKGYVTEACTVLEFAISTKTDISGTYSLLKKIYEETNCPEKIQDLQVTASFLQSASKKTILKLLDTAEN